MQLVLLVVLGFVLIGLFSKGFQRGQVAVVMTFACVLAFAQFFFARFL